MGCNFSPKQPGEEYYVGLDFYKDIDDGGTATIADYDLTVVDAVGTDVTETLVDTTKTTTSEQRLLFWIRAGTSGQTYKITGEVTTSTGEKYEMDSGIYIKER